MGLVMFDVGLFFLVLMMYFAIGFYYRARYGFLFSLTGVLLYFLGLVLGLGLLARLLLLLIPVAVMTMKRRVTGQEFDKTRVYCPKCGWPNEPDAEFCRGFRCGEPLEKKPAGLALTDYFPPWLMVVLIASVFLGMMLYETIRPFRFLIILIYAAWPAVVFLVMLFLVHRKLR